MDRLVAVDVKELQLLYRPSHRAAAPFTITNLMHTMSVAISLTTTTTKTATAGDGNPSSAHLFSFSPAAIFILPPLSSATFSLVLAPTPSLPISAPDSVLLRSTMLPTGRASPDALRRLFSSPGRHIFRDASLPVPLVGPHVVRSLLLRGGASPATLETAFHLSRAISGCSPSDLAALLVDAARTGNPKFVAAILAAGADPNPADGVGNSAIAAAVESGHFEVAKVLLDAGAKPDGRLLLLAAELAADDEGVDLLAALAESAADVNSADESGRSAVHKSASRGLAEAVRVLVAHGADPALADAAGWTPLHCAAAGNHPAAAELLLSAAPCTKYVVTRDGEPPFALADNENRELMDLLRLGDCLHRAASADDANGVRNCLARGAKVDGRDQNGWTALHRAAWKGRLEVVKVLVGAGAQIDAVDDAGYTPLQCAVEAGQGNVGLYLEAHGARVNYKTVKRVCGGELRRVQLSGEEKGVVHS